MFQLSDVLTKMNSYLGFSATDTQIEKDKKISAINSALAILSSMLSLPNSEKEYEINYDEETNFYFIGNDVNSIIDIYYSDNPNNQNLYGNSKEFIYLVPEKILKMIGQNPSDAVLWSFDDSSKKLIILTSNIFGSMVLDDCDSTNGWVLSDDAENLQLNSVDFKYGNSSLQFDINVSLSANDRATLTKTFNSNQDLSFYKNNGEFSFWIYIQDTSISSITLKWRTDSSNYWQKTTTTQHDGSPFVLGWNLLKFSWSNSIKIGNPDEKNIGSLVINIDYGSSFTSSMGWLIDKIKVGVSDTIIAKAYTNKLVYNGTTYVSTFSSDSDIAYGLGEDVLLLDLLALQACLLYNIVNTEDRNWILSLYKLFLEQSKSRYPKKVQIKKYGQIIAPTLR